jgi:hypothetical protein
MCGGLGGTRTLTPKGRQILSLLRLPIPPQGHVCLYYKHDMCQVNAKNTTILIVIYDEQKNKDTSDSRYVVKLV